MINVKLPNSRKDDYRAAKALWNSGAALVVCGGSGLPNGTQVCKGDLPGETIVFDPTNSGFGFYL